MLLLAGCALFAPKEEAPEALSAAPPEAGTVLDGAVPARLLELPLVDHAGRPLTIGSFEGRVVVISDVSTLCQETCAIGTASMLQAARAVERAGLGHRVEFLSITIDPARDDLAHLAAYRREFGPLRNWETVTGSPSDIRYLWDKLGVWRRTVHMSPPYERDWLTGRPLRSDIQHTDDLVFIDADQRFRFLIDGPGSVPSPRLIPRRIYAFMDSVGHHDVRRPSAGSWSAAEIEQVLHWMTRDGGTQP